MLKPKAPFSFQPLPVLASSGAGLDEDLCTKGGDKRDSAAGVLVPPILIVHQGTPRDGKSPSRSLETLSSTQQLQLGPVFHPQNKKIISFSTQKRFFFMGGNWKVCTEAAKPNPMPCKYFSPAVLLNQTD